MGGLVKVGPSRKSKKFKRLDTGTCYYCRCQFERMTRTSQHHETVDHRIPTSRGGTNHPSNKVRCCWLCNNIKANMTDIEFERFLKTGVRAPHVMLAKVPKPKLPNPSADQHWEFLQATNGERGIA